MSHLTVAANERAFRELFNVLRDNFSFADADSGDFGPFSAGYNIAFHLANGAVDLRADNTVQIKELDILWDKLIFTLGFDIPEICVGGWCIPMPWPIPDICLPELCAFSDDPDISFDLDLSGVIRSEVSVTARPVVKHRVDPNRLPWMTDLDAEDAGVPNRWQIFIDPVTVDIDVFDVADIIGDLLEDAVDAAIDGLLGWMPDWAKDIVKAILGPIIDLIRDILDIPDDIGEWLSDLLGVSLGLFNTIVNFVADYFAAKTPLYEFEDPFPVLDAVPGVPLIPVKIPIRSFDVRFTADEMIIEANVGA
jgi:hypothetical protein